MTLAHELTQYIRTHGAITVAEYMQRCNAHYYATRDPLGAKGDFTTSPEISQIFGELIGAWMANVWQEKQWREVILCESGSGRGTLMNDALRATKAVAGFHDALTIRLIETSPPLQKQQQEMLTHTGLPITWHATLDDLPPLPLLFIANEFFDALPTEQYIASGMKEVQRKIIYTANGFAWEQEGKVVRETSPTSLAITAQIATHIAKFGGAALIIDYGHDGKVQGDTLQAVKAHNYANILENPGEADLTTHVDFGALARAGQNAGAYSHGPLEQGTFLKRLGAELRATALCKSATAAQQEAILAGLERLVAPHQMGALFKVFAITSSLEAPAGF